MIAHPIPDAALDGDIAILGKHTDRKAGDLANHRDPHQDLPENHNDLPKEERYRIARERMHLLHLFGQGQWHDDVRIVGNRNALLVLRDAVDAALSDGSAKTRAMTRDGEGYSIKVEMNEAPCDHPAWETLSLPYSDPVAQGGPDPWADVVSLRHALRRANEQLLKRGVRPIPDPTKDGKDGTA